MHGQDEDLTTFAQSLDASYEFADLRPPKQGDGFSGPDTDRGR